MWREQQRCSRRAVRCLCWFLLPLLTGCGSVQVTSTTTGATYDGALHKLLVVSSYGGSSEASRAAFYQGLRAAFGRCNVTMDIFPTDGPQLNLVARINRAMETTGADSRLLIQWRLEQRVGQNRDETYTVVLQDMNARADVWKAQFLLSHMNWMTADGVSDDFARQVVEGLVKSHILKTCPVPSATSSSSAPSAG
jgi:hypothetical protein